MKRQVCRSTAWAIVALCCLCAQAQQPRSASVSWQTRLSQTLPLLGHRNWILIVDSAYPLQNSSGIETVDTGAGELEVVRDVLHAIDRSIHVRPVVFMDAELPFIPERDAPGVSRYRDRIRGALGDLHVTSLPHEQLLRKMDDTAKSYRVLVLKTNETIPYTSVFLQLNCKYWSDEAEARLREAMKTAR